MRDEGFVPSTEDVRLTVELVVPSSQVGRIIGKGGQNVRELQRATGGIIKLPEQASTAGEETTVHIIGPFLSVQVSNEFDFIQAQLHLSQNSGLQICWTT
jgi:insulin-like growth factor 2 mRNA-binding protein 1